MFHVPGDVGLRSYKNLVQENYFPKQLKPKARVREIGQKHRIDTLALNQAQLTEETTMNLVLINSMNRLLSYRAIRRCMALVTLIIILSPNLILAGEGNNTDRITEQEAISQQGSCEAVCQLPDEASTWTPSSLITQVKVKEAGRLQRL